VIEKAWLLDRLDPDTIASIVSASENGDAGSRRWMLVQFDPNAAADGENALRLLHERGLELLDRAELDTVRRAIDGLDEKTRREDPAILTVRGVAHAAQGRPVRAEGLLRRAIARAGADVAAAAPATLRLALLLANRGEEVGSYLDPLTNDGRQTPDVRAEAWSLLAAQRALAGDAPAAKAAVTNVTQLLPSIERDEVRAKVLQRIGVAAVNSGEIESARSWLEEAADLAMELELYSLASRAYVTLCSLVLEHEDDVQRHRWYAELALVASRRAGNAYDLQTALIQRLRGEMLRGDADAVVAIEAELVALRTGDETRAHALSSFRALRLAWDGNFSEAGHMLRTAWRQFHYDFDRVMAGALCGLFLAVEGQRAASSATVTDVVRQAGSIAAHGLFVRRRLAVAYLYCAFAESINARPLQAALIVRQLSSALEDPVTRLVGRLADSLTTRLGQTSDGCAVEYPEVAEITAHGYGDTAKVLAAVIEATNSNLKTARLTPAELDVLRLLNAGVSPKEVAVRSGRSVFTVRAHIANAIGKLQCRGQAEALAVARRLGIID
jgi:DNA-binding CsgD family transcriptional regulator